MSSQCTRKVLPIAAAAVMLVGGMSRMAAAKECTTDADCGAGNQCNLRNFGSATGGSTGTASDPGAGAVTGSSCPEGTNCTTGSVPVALPRDAGAAPQLGTPDAGLAVPVPPPDINETPLPTPIVTGVCGPKPIVCKTVADCPSADFECVKGYSVSPSPPCTQGQKCETPVAQESETGTCSAKPRACSTAADCPAPLTCQSQGSACTGSAGVGPDGVVTTKSETCTPGPSVCTWLPAVCTQDSECTDPLYQCAKVNEYSMCSASGPACIKGDGIELCPTPEPPTCTTVVIKNCMPKPIDCGLGQTCPSGWSCFNFSNISERPDWSATATDSACLPDGIILAAQGHAAGGGGSSSTRGGSGTSGAVDIGLQTPTTNKGAGSDSNGSVAGPTPAPVTPSSTTGVSIGTGTGAEAAPMVKEGGGCAFGGGKTGSLDLGLALALMGLAMQLARRRNANR